MEAVLDVAETGTGAAAATRFKIIPLCATFYFMTMYFNKPFLMIISDTNTHIALFMAKSLVRLEHPKWGGCFFP